MRLRRALLLVVVGSITSPPTVHALVRRIVHFSDVHLNLSTNKRLTADESSSSRPRYGSDSPLSLLESALTFASRVVATPDILLYTGDHVTHGHGFSNDYVREVVETNVRMLEKYFPTDSTTGKPHHVTAITGNSDSNVSYSMDVTEHDVTATHAALPVVASVWASSLPAAAVELLERRGYLQYDVDDRLTVLTLNTIPYSPSHYPDTSYLDDPFDQFAWLNATLQSLRVASRFAFLAGHIPPIVDSNRTQLVWHEHYIQSYQAIVSAYRDVIKAQIFGHVHSLEFRIPPIEMEGLIFQNPMPPLFTSGALSPKYGNNPSFLVWEYDAETYEILDYIVYGTDWSTTGPFEWTPLLQATSAYGLASLSTPELVKLRARIETDTASLLSEYYWNMKARSFNLPTCDDAACRRRTLCTLTWWPTEATFAACVQSMMTSRSGGIMGSLSTLPLSHTLLLGLALLVAYGVLCAVAWAVRRNLRVAHASPAVVLASPSPQKKTKPKRHWVLPAACRKSAFVEDVEAREAL